MKAEFIALIKKHEIKSLVSGDKEAWLTLQFKADEDELVDGINRLHRADAMVRVTIKDNG